MMNMTMNDSIVHAGLGLLTGIVVGAGVTLLLAPQSGARTRRQLTLWGKDIGERVDLFLGDARAALKA